MRWALPVLGLMMLAGCPQNEAQREGQPTEPQPEQQGSFLNEPSGVPPEPLQPEQVEVRLIAASDPAVTEAAAKALSGNLTVWGSEDVSDFLYRYRIYYAPTEQLEAYARAKRTGTPQPELAAVAPDIGIPLPVVRMAYKGMEDVQRQDLLALVKQGARGNLVLWYPLMEVRNRLMDGRAGLWRGITRMREGLPGTGPLLGGTPRFLLAAIASLDQPLLKNQPIAPLSAPLDVESFFNASAERKAVFSELGTPHPNQADLPKAWRDLFKSPKGTPVAYLIPKHPDVMHPSFDVVVEGLVNVVNQGGQAWLLISLPLAQERKPERF